MNIKLFATLIQYTIVGLALFFLLMKAFPAHAENLEPAFQLSLKDAEKAISDMLREEGVADHPGARIDNNRKLVLYKYTKPFSVAIKTLKYNTDERSFSGNLYFMDGEEVLSAIPVSGTYEELVEVPMLKRSLSKGQPIGEENIIHKLMSQNRLRADTVTDEQQLLGQTPRRAISQNRPIRKMELTAVSVVEKGSMVTMRYNTPYMTITTVGQALQPGGEGEVIRVKNSESNITVSATVLTGGEVLVGGEPRQMQVSAR